MEWITSTKILDEMGSLNDGDAWRKFYNYFQPMLINFGRRLGLSTSQSEDAAQKTWETFVRLFRARKYRRERGHLHDWLFGIARRVMLNIKKDLPREQLIADNQTGTSFWELIEDKKAVKHTWNSEWRGLVLKYCLEEVRKKFSSQTFKTFELYALLGNSAEEVAKELNISTNVVYISSCRILQKIRGIKNDFEKTF
jgi:RNA polymerase sigma factor (sigma-70 family)